MYVTGKLNVLHSIMTSHTWMWQKSSIRFFYMWRHILCDQKTKCVKLILLVPFQSRDRRLQYVMFTCDIIVVWQEVSTSYLFVTSQSLGVGWGCLTHIRSAAFSANSPPRGTATVYTGHPDQQPNIYRDTRFNLAGFGMARPVWVNSSRQLHRPISQRGLSSQIRNICQLGLGAAYQSWPGHAIVCLLVCRLDGSVLASRPASTKLALSYGRLGGGPRVVVSTAAFHARVRGSVPGLGGLKETKLFLPHPRVKVSIVGSLRDREVACSASDRQGSNFESCVWRTVSSQSSHHPQEVLLAQFSLYVHKGGLKPDSFHFSYGRFTNDLNRARHF